VRWVDEARAVWQVKTATQMTSLSFLLLVQPPLKTALEATLYNVGMALMIASTILTVTSAWGYAQAAWPALSGESSR
jgi:phosphatidylglycerophosphate synthase